jgi:hypothetical protein
MAGLMTRAIVLMFAGAALLACDNEPLNIGSASRSDASAP